MLIEEPHTLGRVHGRAAAQRNDHIRLEGVHRLYALHDGGDRRIGLDLGEDFSVAVFGALSEVIEDFIDVPELDHHRVGDDEGAGDVGHLLKILDGIFLEVDLRRNLEPLHIDSPLGDALFVDQVDGGHVGGGGVVSERTAAEGQGRGVGVVDVADGALGRRRVGDHAPDLHLLAVGVAELFVVGMDDRAVPKAAEFEHLLGLLKAFLGILDHEIGQNRGELLAGERVIRAHVVQLGEQDLGAFRNLDARLLGDPPGRLTDHDGVDRLLLGVDDVIGNLLDLVALEEIAAVVGHDLLKLRCDLLVDDGRLLGGADHAVVEGLGEDQVVAGALDVHILVDVAGHVAGADAERRLAAGVGALDHAGAAGGQNHRNAGMVHQSAGRLDRGVLDPLNAPFRGAVGDGRIPQDLGRLDRAFLRGGVEAEDDRVAGLNADQGFEHGGGGRVGDRGDARDHADRLGYLDVALHLVLVHDPDGLLIFNGMPDVFGGEDVFDDLVLEHAAAGLVHRHLGQVLVVVQPRERHRMDDLIDLLLRHVHERLERLVRVCHQLVNHRAGFNGSLVFLFCHFSSFLSQSILGLSCGLKVRNYNDC